MATADALTLVLEADPTNFEDGMGRAEQSADDFKQTQEQVAMQNLETMAAMEAVTSGLNGLVGGYSKSINAMKDMMMGMHKKKKDVIQATYDKMMSAYGEGALDKDSEEDKLK